MRRLLKRLLPKTLFVRGLLIVVLPTVLVQAVAAYIFYERHWENVTKHMANALAGEIAFLARQAEDSDPGERAEQLHAFRATTGIRAHFERGAKLPKETPAEAADLPDFQHILDERIDENFTVRRLEAQEMLEIKVQLKDGVLSFRTTLKRLESSTTVIFMLWMVGASLVFLCIAIVFLRNQVRPIRRLAEAAEGFGKGRDIGDFKPHGAQEVRRAARAFLVMRERILRQIRSRTEMLAGISHDLRTPLTRMKLQLAMLAPTQEVQDLQSDVAQMERMITEYLDFARGDSGEESERISIVQLLQGIADDYRRLNKEVPCSVPEDVKLEVRPGALIRMLHNIIDNALRYGGECSISTRVTSGKLEIYIDDKGPGIPPDQREEVFRPFTRLDASRNPKTGGVGLGLTIARDVARSHGGNIKLLDAPGGGLRVVVRLPL